MKQTIGERIKELRIKQDLKQQELANEVGVSKSTIGMYERNERNPDYDTLQRIADFFNVTRPYLLGDTNIKNESEKEEHSIIDFEKVIEELGIQDLFFHNIEELKNLTDDDIMELRSDIEYTIRKAKRRKEEM